MFKLVQLLANFVVKQYEKEAQRLHNFAESFKAHEDSIREDIAELTSKYNAALAKLEAEFAEKHEELQAELQAHLGEIDTHVENAVNATDKAAALSKLVK